MLPFVLWIAADVAEPLDACAPPRPDVFNCFSDVPQRAEEVAAIFERTSAPPGSHWWLRPALGCEEPFEGNLERVDPAGLGAEIFGGFALAVPVPADATPGDEVAVAIFHAACGRQDVVLTVDDAPLVTGAVDISDLTFAAAPTPECFGTCVAVSSPPEACDPDFRDSSGSTASQLTLTASGRALLFVDVEPRSPFGGLVTAGLLLDAPAGAAPFGPFHVADRDCPGRTLTAHVVARDVDTAAILFDDEVTFTTVLPPEAADVPPCESGGCRQSLAPMAAPTAFAAVLLARLFRRRKRHEPRGP